MATHNVTESDVFTTNVQMPADGDSADASDFEATTIVPLTNRTRWLKNLVDALKSAFSFPDNVTWTLPSGKSLKVRSAYLGIGATGGMDLSEAAIVKLAANVEGPLFGVGPGRTGRANKKPTSVAPGAGTFEIDPLTYSTVFVTPSANCNLRIQPSETPAQGEWLEVVCFSSSFSVQVVDSTDDVTIGNRGPLKSASGSPRSAIFVYEAPNWKCLHAMPFDL